MISPISLVISFALVLVAMYLSYREELGLTKEIAWSAIRMVIQLIIVGYILMIIFDIDAVWLTLISLLIMVFNATWNASHRAGDLPHSFRNSFVALSVSVIISLTILVLSGAIDFIPSEVIPVNGMLVGNGMNVLGLSYRNLHNQFKSNQQQVQEKLALGADMNQASKSIIQEAVRGSLQPTIDSTKTVGLVALPGMMTGLIIAGVNPLDAIMYQMMVYFMLLSTAAITSVVGVYLSYREYFTSYGQLIQEVRDD